MAEAGGVVILEARDGGRKSLSGIARCAGRLTEQFCGERKVVGDSLPAQCRVAVRRGERAGKAIYSRGYQWNERAARRIPRGSRYQLPLRTRLAWCRQ